MLVQVYIETRTGDSTSPNGGFIMSAYNIGILVGIAVALGIWAVIAAFNKKRGKPGEFDERQELIRGKAYQHAFFAVMCFSALYGLAVVVLERPLMADGVAPLLAVFVGVLFFAVESIVRDAFFTAKNRPKSYIILYIAAIFSQIVNAVGNIRDGGLVQDGVLTMKVLPIMCAAVFAVVLAAILVKTAREPKEDADE